MAMSKKIKQPLADKVKCIALQPKDIREVTLQTISVPSREIFFPMIDAKCLPRASSKFIFSTSKESQKMKVPSGDTVTFSYKVSLCVSIKVRSVVLSLKT